MRRDDFSSALRFAAPSPVAVDRADLDPLGLVRLIRRRFWLIAAVAAVVIALALPIILSAKPTYVAGSRLLIQNPLATALASSAEERMVRLNLTTEVERMLSRDVAIQVIEALAIDETQEFNPALREEDLLDRVRAILRPPAAGSLGDPSEAPVDDLDVVIGLYLPALTVVREPMSDVVRIEFASEDPKLAAAVPNTLLDIYLKDREASLIRDVSRANAWLNERIVEQQTRLEAAKAAVEAFEASSGLTSGDRSTEANQAVATLAAVRTDIERKRFDIEASLADLEAAERLSEKVALVPSEALDALDRELRLRRAQLDRLSKSYGDGHSSVVEARWAVDEAEAELEVELGRRIQSMRSKLAMLERQESTVSAQLADANAAVARLDLAEATRAGLELAVDAEQAMLDRLQEQGRALAAEGKLPVADVEVLSPATPPLAPLGRGRLFYLLAISVAAGAVGMTAAMAYELADRSVRSFQQLEGIAGLTEGAMLPSVPRRVANSVAELVRRGHEGRFGEAVRGLILTLDRSGEGEPPSSLLVTSPLPQEGKSLVAAAVAVELAAEGRRVLLVDADAARGELHRLFRCAAAPGFAEYLRGEAKLEDVVRHDPTSGVDFVPRGLRVPRRPVGSDRIGELIAAAGSDGRILIFDSAPAFVSTETTRLAAATARTILVVRWGRTTRDAVASAVAQLRASPAVEVLAAINLVNPRRHGLYGYKEADAYSKALRRYETSYTRPMPE